MPECVVYGLQSPATRGLGKREEGLNQCGVMTEGRKQRENERRTEGGKENERKMQVVKEGKEGVREVNHRR